MEPYLIQQGLLQRTPRGRMLTLNGYKHLGLTPSSNAAQADLLEPRDRGGRAVSVFQLLPPSLTLPLKGEEDSV